MGILASLPFAPEIALPSIRSLLARFPELLRDGRLSSSVNPSITDHDKCAWVSTAHYGLDQGIVLMMIENHRSEHFWRLMCACSYIRNGLLGAGFRDGWLAQTPPQGAP